MTGRDAIEVMAVLAVGWPLLMLIVWELIHQVFTGESLWTTWRRKP